MATNTGALQGFGSNLEKDSESLPNKAVEEHEAPEGGTKAWLSLIGASCAMFVSFGWANCIALFQAEYETNQLKQYSKSAVSWITSMECEYFLLLIFK
jgi:hypothetical protein